MEEKKLRHWEIGKGGDEIPGRAENFTKHNPIDPLPLPNNEKRGITCDFLLDVTAGERLENFFKKRKEGKGAIRRGLSRDWCVSN